MPDDDDEISAMSRTDIIERVLHTLRDFVAGLAIQKTDVMVTTDYPLSKHLPR